MQRIRALILLSALLVEPASAENHVTVYGVADVTFESVRAEGATVPASNKSRMQRVSNNSSLVGFKGTENLGEGLEAFFQLESAVNIDDSGGNFATRDSYVGLRGQLGTLRIGFMTAPMRSMGGKLNFIPGSTSIANNIGIMTNLNGRALGFNSRLANAVIYGTPRWNGLAASFAYGANEGRTTTKNDPTYSFGVEWARNEIFIGYAFERRKDKDVLATTPSTDSNHRIAVRYMLKNTKIGVGFDRQESEGRFGAVDGSAERDAYSFALSHMIGAHEFLFHYADARRLRCSGGANTGECAAANVGETGAKQVSLAYHYFFTKRTLLQAYWVRITNDAQGRYDFDTNPVANSFGARAVGADPTGAGLGLRHSF